MAGEWSVAKAIVRPAAGELPKAIVGQKQWRSRYQRANRDSSRGCRPGVREALRSRERHRPGQCCGCQCEDATDGGGGWRFPRGKHERRAPGPHVAAEAKPRLRAATRSEPRSGPAWCPKRRRTPPLRCTQRLLHTRQRSAAGTSPLAGWRAPEPSTSFRPTHPPMALLNQNRKWWRTQLPCSRWRICMTRHSGCLRWRGSGCSGATSWCHSRPRLALARWSRTRSTTLPTAVQAEAVAHDTPVKDPSPFGLGTV